ncbi:hypothetical protein [Rossellomorea marisflavi]|uniref:hypothetical protein n=1 Tax=Rossellomorea marisflavi TaxID=189381 RepID=UPI00345B1BC0
MTKFLVAIICTVVVSTGGVFAYQAITAKPSTEEVQAVSKETKKADSKKDSKEADKEDNDTKEVNKEADKKATETKEDKNENEDNENDSVVAQTEQLDSEESDEVDPSPSVTEETPVQEDTGTEGNTGQDNGMVETVDSSINMLCCYADGLHFGDSEKKLIELFGEPLRRTFLTDGTIIMSYSDASYSVDSSKGVNYVAINQEKASEIFDDFDDVSELYNYDGVYAAYLEERSKDYEGGYKLQLSGYQVRHTYLSPNENGHPISHIFVEQNEDINFN